MRFNVNCHLKIVATKIVALGNGKYVLRYQFFEVTKTDMKTLCRNKAYLMILACTLLGTHMKLIGFAARKKNVHARVGKSNVVPFRDLKILIFKGFYELLCRILPLPVTQQTYGIHACSPMNLDCTSLVHPVKKVLLSSWSGERWVTAWDRHWRCCF